MTKISRKWIERTYLSVMKAIYDKLTTNTLSDEK